MDRDNEGRGRAGGAGGGGGRGREGEVKKPQNRDFLIDHSTTTPPDLTEKQQCQDLDPGEVGSEFLSEVRLEGGRGKGRSHRLLYRSWIRWRCGVPVSRASE